MTTLEMLNASKEEPGVKFMVLANSHPGCYYSAGRFCNPKGYDIGPSVTWFMEQTWEREKPEPLRGEIEFEADFNSYGTLSFPTLADKIREAVTGDPYNIDAVQGKRFRVVGTVEEIV